MCCGTAGGYRLLRTAPHLIRARRADSALAAAKGRGHRFAGHFALDSFQSRLIWGSASRGAVVQLQILDEQQASDKVRGSTSQGIPDVLHCRTAVRVVLQWEPIRPEAWLDMKLLHSYVYTAT